jgi:hypothetical protein
MENVNLYRPVGNDFLDSCNRLAFWNTVEGMQKDFPDSVVKEYNWNELQNYFSDNNLDMADIQVYR